VAARHNLPQSLIYSWIDFAALPGTIDDCLQHFSVGKQINETHTADLVSSYGEWPLYTAITKKRASSPAAINRLAHCAALQAVVQNSNRNGTDVEAGFDVMQHIQFGKNIKQLHKALDAILSEEEGICLAVQ
jgi:hypothetical protein